jgi:hypothetical protein
MFKINVSFHLENIVLNLPLYAINILKNSDIIKPQSNQNPPPRPRRLINRLNNFHIFHAFFACDV